MGIGSMKPVLHGYFSIQERLDSRSKAPMDFQALAWFTNMPGTEQGKQAGVYGPKMGLFFSLGKEIYKRRLWKGASLSIGGSDGGTCRGDSFTRDFERQVTIWRAHPLGSLRDMYEKALETGISLHRGPIRGTQRKGSLPGALKAR
jgi:hypothetical protein